MYYIKKSRSPKGSRSPRQPKGKKTHSERSTGDACWILMRFEAECVIVDCMAKDTDSVT
jgi:hypothetical protein